MSFLKMRKLRSEKIFGKKLGLNLGYVKFEAPLSQERRCQAHVLIVSKSGTQERN